MAISIKGISKAAVLKALYDASQPLGMGMLHYDPTPMTLEEAEQLLAKTTSFDYLKGRVMKLDLKSDEAFDEFGYDRDNGDGAAQRAVDSIGVSAGGKSEDLTMATTLAEAWESFKTKLPEDAPPIQLQEMRRAFYSGMNAMFSMMVNIPHDQSDEWAEKRMMDYTVEFSQFAEDLLSGKA